MNSGRRLRVRLARGEAMRVTRVSIGANKLCYLIVADRLIKYDEGLSCIAYIGTTAQGVGRIAGSAAYRADTILGQRGIQEFHVRVVTCQPRQRVRSWKKLERALLLTFREMYGEVPLCNNHGKNARETDEFEYFARSKLANILKEAGE